MNEWIRKSIWEWYLVSVRVCAYLQPLYRAASSSVYPHCLHGIEPATDSVNTL